MRNDQIEFKKNSISFLRLLSAFHVLFGHAREHLMISFPEPFEGVYSFIHSMTPAVPFFFFISGYLIWHSVDNNNSCKHYFKKRFFRIYPELWAGLIIEIILIIIFHAKEIKLLELCVFTITQGTIFQFYTPNSLRVFGCGTPNGSLWTICVLIQYYLIVWIIRKMRNRKALLVCLFISIIVSYVLLHFEKWIPALPYKILCQTLIPYAWIFILGMIAYEYRKKILTILTNYYYCFFIIAIIFRLLKIDIDVVYCKVIRTIILNLGYLGLAYRLPKLRIRTDVSYGLFIYHMLVINVFIEFGMINRSIYLLYAVVISTFLAIASNYIINKKIVRVIL